MKVVLYVITLALLGFFIGKFIKHKSLSPFMPFRYDFRKRRDTFKRSLLLLQHTKAKVIIETGTSREGLKGAKSNGAATIVFGKWAKQNDAFLHSVDINEKSIVTAQKEVNDQGLSEFVQIHHSDS